MKNSKNSRRGITLVGLVVTIIILLILAGISIATLTGSGLFEKAKLAKEQSEERQKEEEQTLGDYANIISNYTSINNTRNNAVTNYLTEEQVIGTWIDGKTIYQKVIELNQALEPNSSYKNIEVEYIPIDKLIYIDTLYQVSGTEAIIYTTTTNRGFVAYQKYNDGTAILQIKQEQTSSTGAYATVAIMQYTKTTD